MNYGELLSYWYLRLNGFFLISNFVIHRSRHNRYSSDIDLLGIRLPYVYEEVGGQADDWDNKLKEILDASLPTGVICEVKTGNYDDGKIFQAQYLRYVVDRFGFIPNLSRFYEDIVNNRVYKFEFNGQSFQVFKLFVSNKKSKRTDFLQLTLDEVREFINRRITKYKTQKWQDRVLFQCDLLADYIDRKYQDLQKDAIGD